MDKLQICKFVKQLHLLRTELRVMYSNIFKRPEVCLRAEGRHFEHLL
jgi:hypothetical protein